MGEFIQSGPKIQGLPLLGLLAALEGGGGAGKCLLLLLIIHTLPQGVVKVAGDLRVVHRQWRREPMHYVAESYFFPKLLFTAIGWDIPLVLSP